MKTILVILLGFTVPAFAQEDFRSYYAKAMEAYKAKSYPQFYTLMKEANTLHPWHQGILYQLGTAAALTGHPAEAIENLQKAILIDTRFKLEGISDFNAIKNLPAFKKLVALQKETSIPLVHSDTAFTLKDRGLHCEGIEYDPATATFYAGSIHRRKIVKIHDGVATDFCPPGIDGMTSIFGIKVDAKRKFLWACSSPMKEMDNYDSTLRSAVFKFDLNTGHLVEKYARPSTDRDGVFGDLIMDKKGGVYVSDSETNTVFIVNEKTHQLEPWFTSGELWNMQGLAFSDDEKSLFLSDYVKGLFRLDIKTKKLSSIACALPVSLKGVDGLNFYKNSLIGIQNGVYPLRATRYFLNDTQDRIVRYEIIDREHPAFNEPTLGVVSGNEFYYIANSQWGGYDEQHHQLPNDQLHDIVILKSKLK